jgi:hypothetical protein
MGYAARLLTRREAGMADAEFGVDGGGRRTRRA